MPTPRDPEFRRRTVELTRLREKPIAHQIAQDPQELRPERSHMLPGGVCYPGRPRHGPGRPRGSQRPGGPGAAQRPQSARFTQVRRCAC